MSKQATNGREVAGTEPDREAIAAAVQQVLDRHRNADLAISVEPEGMHQRNDWWYVPVRPSRRIEKVTSYYELLAELEEEVDETTGLNVLFVPSFPDEYLPNVSD